VGYTSKIPNSDIKKFYGRICCSIKIFLSSIGCCKNIKEEVLEKRNKNYMTLKIRSGYNLTDF